MGVADVRAWLAEMEPGSLDGWIAYYQLEPWDRTQQPQAMQQAGPPMMSAMEAARRANGL